MTEDKLSFLDEPDMPDAPAPEPTVETAADPAPSQPRDEQGRFAAARAETGETTTDAPPASDPQKAEQHTAPIAAVTAEREKRQAAERQAAEFQRRIAELEARSAQPARPEPERPQAQHWSQIPLPDPVQEPERFQQVMQFKDMMRERDSRAAASEFYARREFGDDAVNAAIAAAEQAGMVAQFATGQFDSWQRLVRWHKQQQVLGEVGEDPAAYRERILSEARESIEAEIRAKVLAEMNVQTAPSAPPPSLAAAPSTGAPRQSPGSAFDNAFS